MDTIKQAIDAMSGIIMSLSGLIGSIGVLKLAIARFTPKRKAATAKNIPPAKAISLDAKVSLKKEERMGFGILSLGAVPLSVTFIISEPLSRGYVVFCSFIVPLTLFSLMRYIGASAYIEAVEETKAQQAGTANDAQRDR